MKFIAKKDGPDDFSENLSYPVLFYENSIFHTLLNNPDAALEINCNCGLEKHQALVSFILLI